MKSSYLYEHLRYWTTLSVGPPPSMEPGPIAPVFPPRKKGSVTYTFGSLRMGKAEKTEVHLLIMRDAQKHTHWLFHSKWKSTPETKRSQAITIHPKLKEKTVNGSRGRKNRESVVIPNIPLHSHGNGAPSSRSYSRCPAPFRKEN